MFCEDGDPDDPDDAAEECKYVIDADALAETFAKARERVSHEKSGGWRFDSLSRVVERCTREKDVEKKIAPGWRRVLIFCDNAGADVMGMTMLAKALAAVGGKGTKVALVANDTAALNDVTYEELDEYLRAVTRRGGEFYDGDPILGAQMNGNMVAAVNSGQDSTLLNLNNCGSELNDWVNMQFQQVPAGDDWLIVLDGMGRSLESNWDAYKYVKDGVNVLNLAMVKSEINARRLDAEVYDCVVRLRRGGDPE